MQLTPPYLPLFQLSRNGSSNGAHDFGVISPDPVSSEDIVFIQGRKFIKRCKYCYTLWNEQKNEVTGVTKQYIIGQVCVRSDYPEIRQQLLQLF